MSISNTTESAILQPVFNATAWSNYADNAASSPQTNTAVGLYTADPKIVVRRLTARSKGGTPIMRQAHARSPERTFHELLESSAYSPRWAIAISTLPSDFRFRNNACKCNGALDRSILVDTAIKELSE